MAFSGYQGWESRGKCLSLKSRTGKCLSWTLGTGLVIPHRHIRVYSHKGLQLKGYNEEHALVESRRWQRWRSWRCDRARPCLSITVAAAAAEDVEEMEVEETEEELYHD